MDAERFCEILVEEGYPLDAIKDLWADDALGDRATLKDHLIRRCARDMKAIGWIEQWRKENPL